MSTQKNVFFCIAAHIIFFVSVLEGLEMPFIGPQVQGLEPDLTQLKKSMKSVDSDLSKVKRMAVFH